MSSRASILIQFHSYAKLSGGLCLCKNERRLGYVLGKMVDWACVKSLNDGSDKKARKGTISEAIEGCG